MFYLPTIYNIEKGLNKVNPFCPGGTSHSIVK